MTFNAVEISKEEGSPFELYLFLYGDQQPDVVTFKYDSLPTPPGIPATSVLGAAWSPDGKVYIAGSDDPHRFDYYVRGEDGEFAHSFGTMAEKPVGRVTAIAFKPDGSQVLMGCENVEGEDNVFLYQVLYSSGEFQQLVFKDSWIATKPVSGPMGGVRAIAYNPNGLQVLVAHDGFPYTSFYSIAGVTYTEFNGYGAEGAPAICNSIDFRDANTVVVTTEENAPIIYSRVGQLYTRIETVPMSLAVDETIQAARWNPDGNMLVVCRSGAPYLSFFSFDGTDATAMLNVIGGGPGSKTNDVIFDHANFSMLVAHDAAPYVSSYDVQPTVVVRNDQFNATLHGATLTMVSSPDDAYIVMSNEGVPSLTFLARTQVVDDGSSGYYAYTNADRAITATIPNLGVDVTFEPIPMDRDAYSSNGKSDPTNLSIRMPKDTDLANLFKPYPPPQPVGVVVLAEHHSDASKEAVVIWTGRVLTCSREGREAILNCDSSIVSMRRLGLRRNWQYGCPLVLYGSLCKASKQNASVVASVVSFDPDGGLLLTANWFGGRQPADFAGGMLSWVSKLGREYRTIKTVTAEGAISYLGPLRDIKPGTEMTMTLGCNHQTSDCTRLHANILNYGGQPWIPVKNPVKIHPYW